MTSTTLRAPTSRSYRSTPAGRTLREFIAAMPIVVLASALRQALAQRSAR